MSKCSMQTRAETVSVITEIYVHYLNVCWQAGGRAKAFSYFHVNDNMTRPILPKKDFHRYTMQHNVGEIQSFHFPFEGEFLNFIKLLRKKFHFLIKIHTTDGGERELGLLAHLVLLLCM